jgi:hypothetical protein
MQEFLKKALHEDDGVLSFEWTLLVVLLVFGIVSGLAAARDVMIDELGDLAEAVVSWDQSFAYTGIPALNIPGASYVDPPGQVVDCGRQPVGSWGVPPRNDIFGGG